MDSGYQRSHGIIDTNETLSCGESQSHIFRSQWIHGVMESEHYVVMKSRGYEVMESEGHGGMELDK